VGASVICCRGPRPVRAPAPAPSRDCGTCPASWPRYRAPPTGRAL